MTDPELGGELIVRLFTARTQAHVFHLQTPSYAEHKALEDFYTDIVGLADALAENMQGKTGVLDYSDPGLGDPPEDSLKMLLALRRWISDNRADVSDESDVQNQIDEVQSLISSTYYKIETLS